MGKCVVCRRHIWFGSMCKTCKQASARKNKPEETVSCIPEPVLETQDYVDSADHASKGSGVYYDDIELSNEQYDAFCDIEYSHENYFITGKAGTGKSVVLRYFVSHTNKTVAVAAPTGIAAINANGQTLHSLFGLSIHVQNPEDSDQVAMSEKRKELLSKIDVLVIDEISMVRCDVMDMIDAKMKYAKESDEPFGGCQVVVFGDLYQLPPVVSDSEIQQYLIDYYGSEFFFAAPVVRNHPFQMIELQTVHRQNDSDFIDVLNAVRIGDNSSSTLDTINSRRQPASQGIPCITIAPRSAAVKAINQSRLKALPGEIYEYYADVNNISENGFSIRDMPTDEIIKLKVGAQIMMLRNDPNSRWVNGTFATVAHLSQHGIYVKIGEHEYNVDRQTWEKYEYTYNQDTHKLERVIAGTFTQYPIKLAYAITIHKSQGQTYDHVNIDYSTDGAFAPGQTYVALSRCRSFDGLFLESIIQPKDIMVNQQVVQFMRGVPLPPPLLADCRKEFQNSRKKSVRFVGNHIEIDPPKNAKKITGSKFPTVLSHNRFSTPFEAWCDIARVYTKPYEETKAQRAGKIVQPKQYEFIKQLLEGTEFSILSPEDVYGEHAAEINNYDFYDDDQFGGMWDYRFMKQDRLIGVFEMKTTNVKNKPYVLEEISEQVKLQAALYSWLNDLDVFVIVYSFLSNYDLDHPEDFVCNNNNTLIRSFRISQEYPNFGKIHIRQAIDWMDKYVKTGISPDFSHGSKIDGSVLEKLGYYNQ